MEYLILGAGPAGLTFANILKKLGKRDFLVIEKENEAGGLCRSTIVDDSPFDIGGGHFLDVRSSKVNDFLFSFMPSKEWNVFKRNSKIYLKDRYIDHPIEANIWQMNVEEQIEYIKSIALAGCNLGSKMPKEFIEWIYWKLGHKIATDYMIPYNQKMFGNRLNQLGTYWLDKLPNVSFEETLLSCLNKKAYGTQPGHVQFYYPKEYGYGELWRRMSEAIFENIEYNSIVNQIDFDNKIVTTKEGKRYKADVIISTIPWMEFDELKGMPSELKEVISILQYSSIQTEYIPAKFDSDAHWIYYPSLELPYHRILLRHNFCSNSRGYWTETNVERVNVGQQNGNFNYICKYAYPLNTINKPDIMNNLLRWAESKQVFGLGRWGEHQHYNSDVTVERAMNLAQKLVSN